MFLNEENFRNPLVIYIFCGLGMCLRFLFFKPIYLVIGKKQKSFKAYSHGFQQIVYNLLLSLFLIMAIITIIVYQAISHS
jgi:hypothetical protein